MSLNAQAIMTPGGIADQLSRGFSGVAQAMQQARQSNREHSLRMAELEARGLQRKQERDDREEARKQVLADRIAAEEASARNDGFPSADARASYAILKRERDDKTAADKLRQEQEDREYKRLLAEGEAAGLAEGLEFPVGGPSTFIPELGMHPAFIAGRRKGQAAAAMSNAKIEKLQQTPGQGSPPKIDANVIQRQIDSLMANPPSNRASEAVKMEHEKELSYWNQMLKKAFESNPVLSPVSTTTTAAPGSDFEALRQALGSNPK